jgi:opacity protein-like surface antigen
VKKIFLAVAVAAIATMAVAASASAAPVVTTHTVTVNAATDGVVDLPALNSQFTKMTIKVNDGTANWGEGLYTSYGEGGTSTNWNLLSGYWGDTSLPGHGGLLLEGTQVGAVIYRIDGDQWHEVTAAPITMTDGGTHTVQVAYNDRPGSYDDNSGSLSLTVVRTKA